MTSENADLHASAERTKHLLLLLSRVDAAAQARALAKLRESEPALSAELRSLLGHAHRTAPGLRAPARLLAALSVAKPSARAQAPKPPEPQTALSKPPASSQAAIKRIFWVFALLVAVFWAFYAM